MLVRNMRAGRVGCWREKAREKTRESEKQSEITSQSVPVSSDSVYKTTEMAINRNIGVDTHWISSLIRHVQVPG